MDGEEVDGPEWITTESGEHIPLGTGEGLTFARLSEQNLSRVHRWHKNFHSAHSKWTGADWSNATCGEAGEMANVVKKIRRQETGSDRGPDDPDMPRLREMLADEIADVVTYADLLAQYYEIDLAAAVAAKFNRISERQGFPERL
jgi:NTP pyrophosphatase (non-canonical NTP hydrolase)